MTGLETSDQVLAISLTWESGALVMVSLYNHCHAFVPLHTGKTSGECIVYETCIPLLVFSLMPVSHEGAEHFSCGKSHCGKM